MNIRTVLMLSLIVIPLRAMEKENLITFSFNAQDAKRTVPLNSVIKSLLPANSVTQEGEIIQVDCSLIGPNSFDLLQTILTALARPNEKNTLQDLLAATDDRVIEEVQKQFDTWGISLDTVSNANDLLIGVLKNSVSKEVQTEDPEALKQTDSSVEQTIKGWLIQDVQMSNDSTCFATISSKGTTKLWKKDGTLIQKVAEPEEYGFGVAMTANNLTIAGAQLKQAVVWRNNEQGQGQTTVIPYDRTIDHGVDIQMTENGNGVFVVLGLNCSNNPELQIWKLPVNKIYAGKYGPCKISGDAQHVYVGNANNLLILNVSDGSTYGYGTGGNTSDLSCIALINNEKNVITADCNGGLGIYTNDAKFITKYESHKPAKILSVAPGTKNITMFATGSEDGSIGLWNFDEAKKGLALTQTIQGNCGSVYQVQLAFGDHLLFSAGANKIACIWATNNGQNAYSWPNAYKVYVSKDNSTIVVSLFPKGALVLNSNAVKEFVNVPALLRAKSLSQLLHQGKTTTATTSGWNCTVV